MSTFTPAFSVFVSSSRQGGFEDAEHLHLFYGDALGSPAPSSPPRVGGWRARSGGTAGRYSELAFAVPSQSLGEWLTRAITAQVPVTVPIREFGEPVLRLKDPDGVIVKLVGVEMPARRRCRNHTPRRAAGGDAPHRPA